MLLEKKNAVIYGGGGGIGTGIAKAFALEGAKVFLAGRTRKTLAKAAREIKAAGGTAEVGVVDAMDESAVEKHLQAVITKAGSIDVSINLISRGDVQGRPLIEMATEDFTRAILTGITSNFITAKAAARHMIDQGSGVILALNSGSANPSPPMMGSTGPADAVIDTFVRTLAAEIGPSGVRVVGLWIAGVPETLTKEGIAAVNKDMQLDDAALQGIIKQLDGMRMTHRSPRLAEIGATAAFLASDQAAPITGTFVNLTAGMFTS